LPVKEEASCSLDTQQFIMKTVLFLTLFLFLTGCATKVHQTTTSLDASPVSNTALEKPKKLEIDPRLTEKCAPLAAMPVNPYAIEVLEVHKENAINYASCVDRHMGLVEIIKKYIGK